MLAFLVKPDYEWPHGRESDDLAKATTAEAAGEVWAKVQALAEFKKALRKHTRAEFTTKYSHSRGMVSTARSNDPNSGSCQFFVVQKDSTFLDNKYTLFGRVIEGMDVVDTISMVPKDRNDRPLKNVVMELITVETR